MVLMPKVIVVLSCGLLLCFGPSNSASAIDNMKAGKSESRAGEAEHKEMTLQKVELHIIQGDVLRVEGTNYIVQGLDNKEVSLHADNTTVMTGNIKAGDRIEAKVNEQNHALSLLPAP